MNNSERIISQASEHISNINKLLKDVKSNVSADCFYSNNKGVIIITNKIAVMSDLSIIEKYIKESNTIDLDKIMSS